MQSNCTRMKDPLVIGAIMKISIDQDNCIGCGSCEALCPELFELREDGVSHVRSENIKDELLECARDAEEACPVQVITVEE